MKYSGIGGQAVMEGVMMKNKDLYAVAVRLPNGDITVKREKYPGFAAKGQFYRLPFFRGVFNFIDSLILGMSTLNYSSSFFEEDEDEKAKSADKTPEQKKKEETAATVLTMFVSVILALAIFVVGPMLLSKLVLQKVLDSVALITLIEGVLRLAVFIAYVALISLMPDIRRVYMYHGAEHKCINCIEHGLELNVENVRASSREHKRCGTSFMLIVMVIAIVAMIVVSVAVPQELEAQWWFRIVSRLALIPIVAGISYEFLRLGGTHDNAFINALSKPGLLLQGLTTREPEDDMIEVGIASVEAVFDWKTYLKENFEEMP